MEGMPITDEVEELLRVLGPFYELVDEKKKISQISDLSTGRVTTPIFHFMDLETAPRVQQFYNLPLVVRSARLTQFVRQLEGKYMIVYTCSVLL